MSSEEGRRWNGRPVLAGALRVVILLGPSVAAAATVFAVARTLATPAHPVGAVGRIVVLLLIGLAVAFCVERAARRLLPLALILKMTMLFPDQAPSRFRVARRACSSADPAALLRGHDGEDTASLAERLVTLLAALAAHDRRTRGHAERVQVLAELLARQLGLSRTDRDKLRWATLLHDIGKLSVAADVLNKPSKLDPDEWELLRAHPGEGERLAAPLLDWLGAWGPAIVEHHERFDGTGYPKGLAGEQITYAGRLVCLVDAYETMTAARSYKKAMATRDARAELAACAGTHFDPVLVRAFLAISLPRLLWAGGPLAFLVQVPFLPLIEAGGRIATGTLSAASTGVVAGSAALALSGSPGPVPAPVEQAPAAVTVEQADSVTTSIQDETGSPSPRRPLQASAKPSPAPAASRSDRRAEATKSRRPKATPATAGRPGRGPKADTPGKTGTTGKSAAHRSDTRAKPGKADKPAKPGKAAKADKPTNRVKPAKADRADKPVTAAAKADKPLKPAKPEKDALDKPGKQQVA